MAVDAAYARVRSVLVGDELRLHHGVAHLAAKLRRVHELDPFGGGQADDQQVHRRQRDDRQHEPSVPRNVEVNFQKLMRLESLLRAAPFEKHPQRDHEQAGDEERRHDEEEHNPHVRVRVQPERVGQVHEQEQHGADRGQRHAENGQGMLFHRWEATA